MRRLSSAALIGAVAALAPGADAEIVRESKRPKAFGRGEYLSTLVDGSPMRHPSQMPRHRRSLLKRRR